MANNLLALEKMILAIGGQERGSCRLCGRAGRHHSLAPCFTPGQGVKLLACRRCLGKVTAAVYEPAVAKLLALAAGDSMTLTARLTLEAEAERKKVPAPGWDDAVAILVRALDDRQGAAASRIALIKAVRGLTGLGLLQCMMLVNRAMDLAKKPLNVPAGPGVPGPTAARV